MIRPQHLVCPPSIEPLYISEKETENLEKYSDLPTDVHEQWGAIYSDLLKLFDFNIGRPESISALCIQLQSTPFQQSICNLMNVCIVHITNCHCQPLILLNPMHSSTHSYVLNGKPPPADVSLCPSHVFCNTQLRACMHICSHVYFTLIGYLSICINTFSISLSHS